MNTFNLFLHKLQPVMHFSTMHLIHYVHESVSFSFDDQWQHHSIVATILHSTVAWYIVIHTCCTVKKRWLMWCVAVVAGHQHPEFGSYSVLPRSLRQLYWGNTVRLPVLPAAGLRVEDIEDVIPNLLDVPLHEMTVELHTNRKLADVDVGRDTTKNTRSRVCCAISRCHIYGYQLNLFSKVGNIQYCIKALVKYENVTPARRPSQWTALTEDKHLHLSKI